MSLGKRFLNIAPQSRSPYVVEYLVIAGGGSGGSNIGAGGGAGGFRASFGGNTGGGGNPENHLTLVPNTTYTVTVGAGGTVSTPAPYNPGGDGGNSVFSGSDITDITSTGGGGGGTGLSLQSPPFEPGRPGGSGGGGSRLGNQSAPGGTRTASPVQGFNGGASALNEGDCAGGGGGAGAVGVSSADGQKGGRAGGIGLQNSITVASGNGIYYAGGGGGGGFNNVDEGLGGTGGGGRGGQNQNKLATAGTANTGSGGGGGGGSDGDNVRGGGAGGSGVVILRLPTSSYSGTTSGSPSVDQSTVSGVTILKFTGSGSYTG